MQENTQNEPNIELKSKEFRELLSKPPHALVLYGTTVVCLIIALLIAGSFFFYYPVILYGKAIIRQDSGVYKARVYVPAEGSGKVKPGQSVNIKTDAFPYPEYGMIQGKVKTVTPDLATNKFVIEAEFPKDVETGTKFRIPDGTILTGRGEIIIENKRIIEKILPVSKIFFKKNE